MRIGSVCTGYGGLDMAVHDMLSGELAWVADNDPGAAAILAHRYPGVPNLGDITAADWADVESVDVLTAGFPCQPVSAAGRRKGTDDERWLWDAIAQAIGRMGTRPRLLVLENVAGLLSANGGDAMARVVQGLATLSYVGRYRVLRASDAGAPHRRERWFCVAWPAANADGGRRGPEPWEHWRRRGSRVRAQGYGAEPAADAPSTLGDERREPASGQAEGWRSYADIGGRGGVPAADARGAGLEVGPVEHHGPERPAAQRSSGDDAPAHSAGDGRDAWQPEPARLKGGPDAAVRSDAPADTVGNTPGGRLQPVDSGRTDWGAYATAIARWEAVTGRHAPGPTDPGRTGQRLSPRFVEWMMGLPEGWVTDVPGLSRNAQLKALGNGVVPQQAAMALRLLLPHLAAGEAA